MDQSHIYMRRIQYKILESLPHNHSYSIIILSSSHSNICQKHTKEVLESTKQEDVTAWKLNNKHFTDWSTSKNRLHSIFTSLSCLVLQFTMYCRFNTMASIHYTVYIRYSQHLDHAWNLSLWMPSDCNATLPEIGKTTETLLLCQ